MATPGFSPNDLKKLSLYDYETNKTTPLPFNFSQANTGVILQLTNTGASTVTLQFTDPKRLILRNMVEQGVALNIGGIKYVFVQLTKASDQLQMVFESETIYRLNNQTGATPATTGTNVTPFVKSLVSAISTAKNPVKFVAPDYASTWHLLAEGAPTPIGLSRGTTTDPYENSWTAITRIASSIGWRVWEYNNTVFFGPDEYWLGLMTKNAKGAAVPPINLGLNAVNPIPVLKEFTRTVQLIDFDWDVGKPFGTCTVTCTLDNFNYLPGEVVILEGVGPASGAWLVSGIQRNGYEPQATMTLQVPMPFAQVFDPTSLPLHDTGFPLTLKSGSLVNIPMSVLSTIGL